MKKVTLLPLLLVAVLSACGQKAAPPEAAPADAVVVATPAAEPAPAAPAPAPAAAPAAAAPVVVAASAADLAIGEKVYNTSCVSCHGAAVLGAPKLGDKPTWTPRIAKGVDTLYKSAMEGFKMMPPRGGNAALKDEELKAAVDFMVSKAM